MPKHEARSLLTDEVFGDFPFVSPADRANAIAVLLQSFVNLLIEGPKPLIVVDSPTRGTGKSLLAMVTLLITTGRIWPVGTLPSNEEEMRKRITSELLSGTPFVIFDNVDRLKSSALSAVLTAPYWVDRIMGLSKTIRLKNDATWIVTGNNISLSDEIARRSSLIRLDAGVERPEERTGFKHNDLLAWVAKERDRIVSACLSIVHGWLRAGMPQGELTLGSFESWARTMSGILEFLDIGDLMDNREVVYLESDRETREWISFCEHWFLEFGSAPVTAGQLHNFCKEKRLLMEVWAGRSAIGAAQQLGEALDDKRDREYGSFRKRFARRHRINKTASYFLERVDAEPPQTPALKKKPNLKAFQGVASTSSNSRQNPRARVQDPSAAESISPSAHAFAGVWG